MQKTEKKLCCWIRVPRLAMSHVNCELDGSILAQLDEICFYGKCVWAMIASDNKKPHENARRRRMEKSSPVSCQNSSDFRICFASTFRVESSRLFFGFIFDGMIFCVNHRPFSGDPNTCQEPEITITKDDYGWTNAKTNDDCDYLTHRDLPRPRKRDWQLERWQSHGIHNLRTSEMPLFIS